MSNQSSNTFWNLISQSRIVVPKLQRDYAQGRPDLAIKQIRESLISEIHDSLILENKPLVLNFIYGEREETEFVPIDGQQRLTTLFLLHWYIFARTAYVYGCEKLRGFSYCTRDTSKRFCESIIDLGNRLDYSKNTISEQIKNSYWYSRNFENDPTVRSMLCVIDCIHKTFKDDDHQRICDRLVNEDCPISFLWLPMDHFQNTDDLYIKMNARGKLLSDFEIFKAKLQSSSVLDRVLGGCATESQRIMFISRFNNQYAELFFRHLGENYDSSMMAFFRILLRDDFFAYACEKSVQQKYYRDDYKKMDSLNGSMLFRFVEQGGMNTTEYAACTDAKEILSRSIGKIDNIFDLITVNEQCLNVPGKLSVYHWDEKDLFITDYNRVNARDTFVRYSLYEYLNCFGYPKTENAYEAFSMWKRFVYNIVINTDISAHTEYMCQTMVVVQKLISSIVEESEVGILDMVANINRNALSNWISGIDAQLKEEIIKATLMRGDTVWREAILEAEQYFEDGQIGFLLEYSYDGNSHDLLKFRKGFSAAKSLFGRKKRVNCISALLERALLCMPDDTRGKNGHLLKQSNSTTTWGFCGDDFGRLLSNDSAISKRKIVLHLMERLEDDHDVNDQLHSLIAAFDCRTLSAEEKWKEAFIRENLFNVRLAGGMFNNCIHLGRSNSEVLLLIGTTVRSYSMELNTYLLYQEMQKKGIATKEMKLVIQTTGDLLKDGFPIRYIEYKGSKIAYLNNNPLVFAVKDARDNIIEKNPIEIMDYLFKL